MFGRDAYDALQAAEILLRLPEGEYRQALARVAQYMRASICDPGISEEDAKAARLVLEDLEQRLN